MRYKQHGRRADLMAPNRESREEQHLVEELWEASRRAYGEARRREICVEWTAHHDRLSRGFRDCS
jgi:hypothetical protein